MSTTTYAARANAAIQPRTASFLGTLGAIGSFPDALGAVHGVIGHALTVGLTSAVIAKKRLARS